MSFGYNQMYWFLSKSKSFQTSGATASFGVGNLACLLHYARACFYTLNLQIKGIQCTSYDTESFSMRSAQFCSFLGYTEPHRSSGARIMVQVFGQVLRLHSDMFSSALKSKSQLIQQLALIGQSYTSDQCQSVIGQLDERVCVMACVK